MAMATNDELVINHDEAMQLATMKYSESNLARCYLDLVSKGAPKTAYTYDSATGAPLTLSELPIPLRMCVEMLNFTTWHCAKTQEKRFSEIKVLLAEFFDDTDIDNAVLILTGKGYKSRGVEGGLNGK